MSTTGWDGLHELLREVRALREQLLSAEATYSPQIDAVNARHQSSATNLVHYVELRSHDIRDLQLRLAAYGLSSLGRSESHVMETLDALVEALEHLVGVREVADAPPEVSAEGDQILSRNAVRLLGPAPADRMTRIMVTLPSEAAGDPEIVASMLAHGMDIARINCAHDGPAEWEAMIANIRAAEAATGRSCLISMDLGGPKLRTGPIQSGRPVLKLRPQRDEIGRVTAPALVWLGTRPASASEPVVAVEESGWAARRRVGDTLRMVDARDARRRLTVEAVSGDGCLVSLRHTAYFVPGTQISVRGAGKHHRDPVHVAALPAEERGMRVRPGDTIILTDHLETAVLSTSGVHRIGCTLPEVFADVRVGERVLIDDGKITTVVTHATASELTLDVRSTEPNGTVMRAEKGINLPDTDISIPALTEQDLLDLKFVKAQADVVEMSFVRGPSDVKSLIAHLGDASTLDIVLKIETVAAFTALPQILLEAMRWEDIGVMIARGDLAVEAGFERLAEVQEEILWLCEAAHVPVIWATQVLDTMARTGVPSRAEVTDAAMSGRAECVMLNKGPFIDEAITMLAGILTRMNEHTQKKRSLLRRLRSWDLDDR